MNLFKNLKPLDYIFLGIVVGLLGLVVFGIVVNLTTGNYPIQTKEPVKVLEVSLSQQYAETTIWCIGRFPGQPDLQEACKWGAYEMIPGEDMK